MKYFRYILNVFEDLTHYNTMRKFGFSFYDILYYEFHPKEKAKKIEELNNKEEKK